MAMDPVVVDGSQADPMLGLNAVVCFGQDIMEPLTEGEQGGEEEPDQHQ